MRKNSDDTKRKPRDEIRRAAIKCYGKNGVHKTTTDDICRAAKISPGKLYYHYGSKEALLKDIAEQACYPEESFAQAEPPIELDITEWVLTSVGLWENSQAKVRISQTMLVELITESARIERVRISVLKKMQHSQATFEQALEAFKRRGVLRADTDTSKLAAALGATLSGNTLTNLIDRSPKIDRRSLVEFILAPWLTTSDKGEDRAVPDQVLERT